MKISSARKDLKKKQSTSWFRSGYTDGYYLGLPNQFKELLITTRFWVVAYHIGYAQGLRCRMMSRRPRYLNDPPIATTE